jgi:diguanylate cyclase (GGDEF)-like protein
VTRGHTTWWLVAYAWWIAAIIALDFVNHDHRLLPILLVVPVIALAARMRPRSLLLICAINVGFAVSLGYDGHDASFERQFVTVFVIVIIGGMAAWVANLRERLEAALRASQRDAARDALTGLHNRRSIDAAANALVDGHQAVVVAMADIDHFKEVNDLYGHAVGDEVLVEIGRRLREGVRQIDLVGRYGGEEFLFVIRGTLDDAADVVARALESVRSTPIGTSAGMIEAQLSAGLAAVDSRGLEVAIHRADEAMYRSKAHGRDRVTIWS